MNWYKISQSNPYTQAVETKDLATAQDLVDQKAQDSGYTIPAFHTTDNMDFTVFRTSGLSAHFGSSKAAQDREISLTDFSKQIGRPVKQHRLLRLYLSLHNPLRIPDMASLEDISGRLMNEILEEMDDEEKRIYEETGEYRGESIHVRRWEGDEDVQLTLLEMGIINIDEFEDMRDYTKGQLTNFLKSEGYDGIVYKNDVEGGGDDSYIIFDPNQVKMADPITRDDGGNFVPLSQRFDSNNPDIRF